MTVLIIGMLVTLLVAGVVVAAVAIPAHREGRDVLSPQGEQIVQAARDRTAEAVEVARDRTVDAVGVAREKVGELAERLPVSRTTDDETAVDGDTTIDLRDEHSASHRRA